ncbi:MAG: HNH endonuclease [bacterium]|nr:HNH endonuclease [bacterium]
MPSLDLPAFTPGRPAADVDGALRQSLAACEEARRCAVLWFAEVQRRELWRSLGHASLELYAVHRLGFSRNRYWQFKRLADDLDRLPVLQEAVTEGRVGWTKAQQVARVATPATASSWVRCAEQTGRRELAAAVTAEVARVKGVARKTARVAAKVAPAGGVASQLALGLAASETESCATDRSACGTPTDVDATTLAIPATIALRADALQAARFEALVEQARKRGLVPAQAGRMELVLAALEQWVTGGVSDADDTGDAATDSTRRHPRRRATVPPAQVIVHRCPDCAAATVTTAAGERPLAPAQVAALACDATVSEPGRPNRATIPPRTRRAVLARDRHRCTTSGCGATAFLEVHHVVPRSRGGSNVAANLVTLCGRCHAFAHEGGVALAQFAMAPAATAPAGPEQHGHGNRVPSPLP